MGQRSQIYIRYKTETGYRLLANYYQWNYGDRMISRARYGIEYLDSYRKYYRWWFLDNEELIRRYFDVNFDYQDIQMHCNINEEFKAYGAEYEFNQYVFQGQDNNDGKLLVDVTETEIRYCFLDHTASVFSLMNAEEYMNWDLPNWRKSEYVYAKACRENIRALNSFPLMTPEQAHDFLTCSYENDPSIPKF